jgi:hypothetical protein
MTGCGYELRTSNPSVASTAAYSRIGTYTWTVPTEPNARDGVRVDVERMDLGLEVVVVHLVPPNVDKVQRVSRSVVDGTAEVG